MGVNALTDRPLDEGVGGAAVIGGALGAVGRTISSLRQVKLFRAVKNSELEDIQATGAFRNPAGVEGKFFSTTAGGAAQFARMASSTIDKGQTFTIVATSARRSLISTGMRATVDRGISTVVIPTSRLTQLASPRIFPFTPVP